MSYHVSTPDGTTQAFDTQADGAVMEEWLCSCGGWHPTSRDPDETHRQVMAVGSEGWDL